MFSRRSNNDSKAGQPEMARAGSLVKYEEFSRKLTLRTKLAFCFGSCYNEFTACIWFSYTLLYFKLSFNDTTAGLLLLLGQVADALATPLCGYVSDRNLSVFGNYGRRKSIHLVGCVFVTCSFPLIFSTCMLCSDAEQWEKFAYYSIFIALFQFGWAAVQVSHLSLITDLASSSSERVELNAYRQAVSVASSICVYSITLLLLGIDDKTISKSDSIVFMKVVHLITLIGIIFSVLFHIFFKEPSQQEEWELKSIEQGIDSLPPKANQEARLRTGSAYSADIKEGNSLQVEFNDEKKLRLLEQGLEKPATLEKTMNESEVQAKGSGMKRNRNDRIWLDWFSSFNFWKICVIYMLSRLYVNVTQVYTPLYLQETLRLAKRNIAIVPFITYFAGFIFSLLCKSRKFNAKIIMCLGCFFGVISCLWIWYCYLQISIWEVFVMAAVFGIGGTLMLIGSLSLTSDLIGDNRISGAWVYGLMSFFDKLINGSVIALVQHLKPASSALPLLPSAPSFETNPASALWNVSLPLNVTDVTTGDDFMSTLPEDPTVFYLFVLVFVSGASVIGVLFTLSMSTCKEVHKMGHSVKRIFARSSSPAQ